MLVKQGVMSCNGGSQVSFYWILRDDISVSQNQWRSLETWSRYRDSPRDPFLWVSVWKVSGLVSVSKTLNTAEKCFIKTSIFQRFFSLLYLQEETAKTDRKMAEIWQKINLEVITTFFKRISAKQTNLWSLESCFRIWNVGLGIFFMKSRSRLEILTRLRSRLHHCSKHLKKTLLTPMVGNVLRSNVIS